MTPAQIEVVAAQLTNLDRKLDAVHASLKDDIGEVTDLARATNGRVRTLESWRSRVEGGLAAISLGKPVVYTAIGLVLGAMAERLL